MPSPGEDQAAHLLLLSWLLGAPGDESLALLIEAGNDHPWLLPAIRQLEAASLGEWQAEHTRLFICGYPNTPCLPFLSAQTQGQMAGSHPELHEFYRGCGLAAQDMPEDYLGTLLECGAWLLDNGEAERYQQLVEQFFEPGLGRYGDKLAAEARLELYRALGQQLGALQQAAS